MNNIWEEIKAKIDIVDVISEYVKVIPNGQNFKALSPFKREKTPSFIISPTKQIWHDFSTGKGGDIFGFICEIENITRAEALKKLAKKAGVELAKQPPKTPEQIQKQQQQITRLEAGFKLLDWAAKLYNSVLLKLLQDRHNEVTKYCLKRGLSSEIIDQFKIGYAPKSSFLLEIIKKNGIDLDLAVDCGLLKRTETKTTDKFSDRLIIPIHSLDSKTVGFTARVLPYDKTDRPKYLNSSQSEWFDKGKLWFGLNLARKDIIVDKKAVIVEGNMDVIAAFGRGLTTTIASQGTSFTLDQLSLIKRFCSEIIVAFDNDSAGKVAAQKLFLQGSELGLEVKQLVIPDEFKDLDEYLQTLDKKQLHLSDFTIQPYLDVWLSENDINLRSIKTDVQKKSILQVIPLISSLDSISQNQYVKKLAAITGLNQTTLLSLVSAKHKHTPTSTKSEKDFFISPKQDTANNSLVTLLNLLTIQAFAPSKFEIKHVEILCEIIVYILGMEPTTMEELIAEKKDELELIWQEIKVEVNQSYVNRIISVLTSTIDQNVSLFFLNPELKERYLLLKQSL
jgi:DNA primase